MLSASFLCESFKALRIICACRTLLVSLFPQRVILTRFGAAPSLAPLVATPTRYSLIIGVVCEFFGANQGWRSPAVEPCTSWPCQRLRLNLKYEMHIFGIFNRTKSSERYAHAVPCWYRFSLNGSSSSDSGLRHPWLCWSRHPQGTY